MDVMSPASDKQRGRPTAKRSKPAERVRDRDATKRDLVAAITTLLAREGFAGIGVNAVAREAGVDKVLLYRYFGGLDPLLEAFAEESNFWPSIDELAGDVTTMRALPIEDRFLRLVDNFIDALRRRPITHEILAWELAANNHLTAYLDRVRERRFTAVLQLMNAQDVPPNADVAAVSAIIGATVNYLLVRARTVQHFSELDIQSDAGWERIRAALHTLVRSTLQAV